MIKKIAKLTNTKEEVVNYVELALVLSAAIGEFNNNPSEAINKLKEDERFDFNDELDGILLGLQGMNTSTTAIEKGKKLLFGKVKEYITEIKEELGILTSTESYPHVTLKDNLEVVVNTIDPANLKTIKDHYNKSDLAKRYLESKVNYILDEKLAGSEQKDLSIEDYLGSLVAEAKTLGGYKDSDVKNIIESYNMSTGLVKAGIKQVKDEIYAPIEIPEQTLKDNVCDDESKLIKFGTVEKSSNYNLVSDMDTLINLFGSKLEAITKVTESYASESEKLLKDKTTSMDEILEDLINELDTFIKTGTTTAGLESYLLGIKNLILNQVKIEYNLLILLTNVGIDINADIHKLYHIFIIVEKLAIYGSLGNKEPESDKE